MADLVSQPAPAFCLQDQNGEFHALSDYKGQWVLIYFYPKDMTPGCTVEAKCFRDQMNDFKSRKVQVLGVSVDDVDSHKKFAERYELNFPLLSDLDKKIVQDYGVWVKKTLFGKKYMGIQRDSFLISPKGLVAKHYEKVNPINHVSKVLLDLKNYV